MAELITVRDASNPNSNYQTTQTAFMNWRQNAFSQNVNFNVAGNTIPKQNVQIYNPYDNNWYSWDTTLPNQQIGNQYTFKPSTGRGWGGAKRSRRRKQKKSRKRKQKKSRRKH
jgi:hypothetical protein